MTTRTCCTPTQPEERQLDRQIAELEASNRMLADFAALVAHDTRGALRRVLSFSELLKLLPTIEADSHTMAFLRSITTAARKIEHLVKEILSATEDTHFIMDPIPDGGPASPENRQPRLAELRAAHAELANSACAVAQDFGNPLAQILGIVAIMESLPVITSNPVCRDMVGHIVAGAQQMQRLINDYLSFMQTERHDLKPRQVSILSLVQLARHELEAQYAGRKVSWQIDPLPEVEGDAAMLGQVIFNLLSNALKYTRKCPETRIEIGAQGSAQEWIFRVRDNGTGFDALAAKSLFKKFGRLHSDPGFEGSGIGLVVVEHIIHRHGGRVWAESMPGLGACFYFTLPVKGE